MWYEVYLEVTPVLSPWLICKTPSETEALDVLQQPRASIQRLYLRVLSETGSVLSLECQAYPWKIRHTDCKPNEARLVSASGDT